MNIYFLGLLWKDINYKLQWQEENSLIFSHFSPPILGVTVLEGPIYAVGGHDGWSYLNTVERWDPQSQQWTFVASMSIARSTVGVAALNGKWVGSSYIVKSSYIFQLD